MTNEHWKGVFVCLPVSFVRVDGCHPLSMWHRPSPSNYEHGKTIAIVQITEGLFAARMTGDTYSTNI